MGFFLPLSMLTYTGMEKKYIPTIGLEIHAELKTKSKMFCGCKNDPDEEKPNVNVCPVCMGHPGTLPFPNKEAIKHVLKVGVAVGGKNADFTEFDRKNYFYPDIPKGYQISQYKYPLVSGGNIKGVELTRIHLEEDTAKSSHDKGDYSLVDFNRSSLPLMELVTEPVIHDAKTAGDFARELQLILRYLDVSEANMEKGEMRVEANISISDDPNVLGTKVEVKNLNSFKVVEKAIEYEISRHIALLEAGEKVVQETRGFDENTGKTFSQRTKEDAHDYRYFPEPDIPKFKLSLIPEFSVENLKKELPELPEEKRKRLREVYGIKEADVEVYVQNLSIANFFERTIENFCDDKECVILASNYIVSDLMGLMKTSDGSFGQLFPSDFGKLIQLLKAGKLSSRGTKDTLAILFTEGGDPEKIAEEKGWILKNDPEALKKILEKIVSENPKVVEEFKSGKDSAVNSLIGVAMKETKGSASPQAIRETLIAILNS
jgi:aspartyl-tRNA(Asn)/glutamyl-tRNA(Gln) amidotransferase subunit B